MSASRDLHLEHTPVLRMIRILEVLRDRMGEGRLPPREDLANAVDFFHVFVHLCHHGKEEQHLFPAVAQAGGEEMRRLVERLVAEHKTAAGIVEDLAMATGVGRAGAARAEDSLEIDVPRTQAAITRYADLIRPHIVTEERSVFPVADRVLPPDVRERIEEGYEAIEQEVIGAGRHEAFQEMILDMKARHGVR